MSEISPAPQRGRPAGTTKASGAKVSTGRPSTSKQDEATRFLVQRCAIFDRRHRPTDTALAAALGVSRHTWLRRAAGVGSLSASQLQAAHRLLDNAAPWLNKS